MCPSPHRSRTPGKKSTSFDSAGFVADLGLRPGTRVFLGQHGHGLISRSCGCDWPMRQSVKMPKEKSVYQNEKSVNRLKMKYRSLAETLDWCCNHYK